MAVIPSYGCYNLRVLQLTVRGFGFVGFFLFVFDSSILMHSRNLEKKLPKKKSVGQDLGH